MLTINLKTQLREKHGPQFSGVQYALWAETIAAGTHESLEEPRSFKNWQVFSV